MRWGICSKEDVHKCMIWYKYEPEQKQKKKRTEQGHVYECSVRTLPVYWTDIIQHQHITSYTSKTLRFTALFNKWIQIFTTNLLLKTAECWTWIFRAHKSNCTVKLDKWKILLPHFNVIKYALVLTCIHSAKSNMT